MPFGLSLQSSDTCDQGMLYRLIGHESIMLTTDMEGCHAISQPVIIESVLIIHRVVSNILIIKIKILAMF